MRVACAQEQVCAGLDHAMGLSAGGAGYGQGGQMTAYGVAVFHSQCRAWALLPVVKVPAGAVAPVVRQSPCLSCSSCT